MCVTFLAFRSLACLRNKYKLIVLNNRDEFFDRKTKCLSWIDGVLEGRDMAVVEQGTWFGINRKGSVGVLLSITEPTSHPPHQHMPSRGRIVNQFLRGKSPLRQYCADLCETAQQYNGFQFLGLEQNQNGEYEFESLTNRLVPKVVGEVWSPGVYGFGNSPPTHPFKKVLHGKKLFSDLIDSFDFVNKTENELFEELVKIGCDQTLCFPDDQIKLQTGSILEDEYRPLCSLFVRYPPTSKLRYGTRSHSVLLVDVNNNATFFERRLVEYSESVKNCVWETTVHRFHIAS